MNTEKQRSYCENRIKAEIKKKIERIKRSQEKFINSRVCAH